jgi:hypothetical protein
MDCGNYYNDDNDHNDKISLAAMSWDARGSPEDTSGGSTSAGGGGRCDA